MKKIILSLLGILLSLLSYAQEIPVPDFIKRPFILTEENRITDFERLVAAVDFKVKGMGYGGTELYYTVNPGRSLKRFPLTNLPKFIIRTEPNQDPSEVIYLSKAYEVTVKKRRFLTSKYNVLGKSKEVNFQFIQIDFKKISPDFYEIIIVDPIGNGEYAFIPFDTAESSRNIGGKVYINCFGIN
jgi:hypothetical protein